MTKRFCDECGKDLTGGSILHCANHFDIDFCWPCFEEHERAEDR